MKRSRAVDSHGISVCPKRLGRSQLIVVDMSSHITKYHEIKQIAVTSEHFPTKTNGFKIIVYYFFFTFRVRYCARAKTIETVMQEHDSV